MTKKRLKKNVHRAMVRRSRGAKKSKKGLINSSKKNDSKKK